jgi:hypothetical protein
VFALLGIDLSINARVKDQSRKTLSRMGRESGVSEHMAIPVEAARAASLRPSIQAFPLPAVPHEGSGSDLGMLLNCDWGQSSILPFSYVVVPTIFGAMPLDRPKGDVTLTWRAGKKPRLVALDKNARRGFPCSHGLEAAKVGSEGRLVRAGWNE